MATRKTSKKSAKKTAKTAKTTARKAAGTTAAPKVRPGVITHTELASADPAATKAWAQKVLGWKFMPPMKLPGMEYHMWDFGNQTGGGIRAHNPPEVPGSIPYCEVADIKAAYAKALKEGATEMMPPNEIPGGMGWIAIVQAPGRVPIGFWGAK